MPEFQQATPRDAGREAWVPRLPMVQTWPVFWTARQEVVAASSVHWPDESWSQLSPAVRDILEGSLAGERRQALHVDLLPLTLGSSGPAAFGTAVPEIDGATEREVRAARACLQFAKRQMPQTAIAVQDAIARKMQCNGSWRVKGLSPTTAQQVVALSHWAMESNNWTVITHALAGDSKPQLLPIAEDLASLEKLSGVKLPYVSALYSAASQQDAGKWEAFWQRCGLRSSFSFVASVSELQSFEHAWLPGKQIPARRTSKPWPWSRRTRAWHAMAMDSVQHQELQEAAGLKSSLTEEDIDQIVHRNLPKADKVTIRTYGPDGQKLGSCEEIVEAALGLQEPGSERPSLASEESVPEEGRSLGSLARRALEEAPWIPDEEEKVILVRAIKRLRERLAVESLASQKQLERLEKAEVSPADKAVSQAHNSLATSPPPLHARCLDF
eukprot:s5543_g3.t1